MEHQKTPEKKAPFNVQASLESVPGVTNVRKMEIDDEYLAWAKANIESPEQYESIKANGAALDVYKYTYLSDGLAIAGLMWVPKNMDHALPLVIWNRGGTREYGALGKNRAMMFDVLPCEIAKEGNIVAASEYRGGFESEGEDEWGGGDVRDVVHLKEIVDKLPMVQPGKIVVAGHSRGGMMTYMLAAGQPWVKKVIVLGGTADIADSAKERPDMAAIFQESFGGSEEEMHKRSATHFYQEIPKDLPILIVHGSGDDRVSVNEARKLRELLVESGHNVEYHEIPGGSHYFFSSNDPDRDASRAIIKRFLKE